MYILSHIHSYIYNMQILESITMMFVKLNKKTLLKIETLFGFCFVFLIHAQAIVGNNEM